MLTGATYRNLGEIQRICALLKDLDVAMNVDVGDDGCEPQVVQAREGCACLRIDCCRRKPPISKELGYAVGRVRGMAAAKSVIDLVNGVVHHDHATDAILRFHTGKPTVPELVHKSQRSKAALGPEASIPSL